MIDNLPEQFQKQTSTTTLFLATQNLDKRRELQGILNDWQNSAKQQSIQLELKNATNDFDIEETGQTFPENARIKAFGYFKEAHPGTTFLLAEDSGLVIDSLDGYSGISPFPGVISKRWFTPELQATLYGKPLKRSADQADLNKAILYLVNQAGKQSRQARYCCAMALLDGKTGELVFESYGEMPLQVANEAKGKSGFGYDPIMKPVADTLVLPVTVAELSPCMKNKLSHRGKAFRDILDYIAGQHRDL